jgi:hypothetical protein
VSRGPDVEVDTEALAQGVQMASGCDGQSWYDMTRSCLMLNKACGELSLARSRDAIGGQAQARRRRAVMAVGERKWCWPSLLTLKEDKEGGTHVGW